MKPNPVLRRLGYSDEDRLVIIHADDIGLCQAGVAVLDDLWDAGIISSMAVMAVCPWFPAAAAFCRAHPAVDAGLHFTITCEGESCRWGPIASRLRSGGLLDEEGYFHRKSETVHRAGKAAAVRAELTAQIKRSQAAGIDLTHVDSHCGTAWHPKFLPDYINIPERRGIPAFFLRMDERTAMGWGYDRRSAAAMARRAEKYEIKGIPLFDRIFVMPLDDPGDRIGTARRALADLPPGLSYFILHPSADTPELRAAASDAPCRVADYRAFTSRELREFIRNSGIHVIGWRVLREKMREITEPATKKSG
ncbi:MAG: polysaccharide deacetylase family protein [Anaerolineales bacterium]